MILQSTIETILQRLPRLYDRFNISPADRNALFHNVDPNDQGVKVTFGKIDMSGELGYVCTFSDEGELFSVVKEQWDSEGEIIRTTIWEKWQG